MADLEKRHLAELTFPEVSRALRALSSTYVERRNKIGDGAALSGAGKRAAFALFYAPLHFLLVQRIASELPRATDESDIVVDLGCGTGAAGAALGTTRVIGVDRNVWALGEASRTYRAFGLASKTHRADAASFALPKARMSVVAAFTMNELPDASRDALLARLLDRARVNGDSILVVEPIARGAARWWDKWRAAFEAAGGRADEWRFAPDLPPIVEKLDRAAGLNHSELTGRSLWLASTSGASSAASS